MNSLSCVYISIDPGQAGGFAVRYPDGKFVLYSMPGTESEVCQLISDIEAQAALEGYGLEAVLEKVGGYTGKGQPGSSMFTFGRGAGVIVGVLLALKIPHREITPQTWQKAVGAGTSKSFTGKSAWKRHLLDLARKRHPNVSGVSSATADALLLLDAMFQ